MPVRHALLGLLAQRPRHGYDLFTAFGALVGGASNWEIRPAQVYTTLGRLEKAGLVERCPKNQGSSPERRAYTVTPQGLMELQGWLAEGVDPEHARDEFFLKLMLVLASGEAEPSRLLQTQRARLYQELHAATTQRERLDPRQELAQILLLDKAIMHLEADLRWLEMVEVRLDEIKDQPLPEAESRPRGRPRSTSNG